MEQSSLTKKSRYTWKQKKKGGRELSEMNEFKKRVLAILKKLNSQKIQTLVDKFQALPIDTQDKLSLFVELVFEKAVDEPGASVTCAQICKIMQMKKVLVDGGEEAGFVNFGKLLIIRCQSEFETHCSIGTIRFIGELYKLRMLTPRIMHECVKKLLMTTDDESLECLCSLITTAGQVLETETKRMLAKGPRTGFNDLSVYFKEMGKLVKQKKISSRVRFIMQDVIELRLNGWKKKSEDASSKLASLSIT
jgi:translation initiation factor 4G